MKRDSEVLRSIERDEAKDKAEEAENYDRGDQGEIKIYSQVDPRNLVQDHFGSANGKKEINR